MNRWELSLRSGEGPENGQGVLKSESVNQGSNLFSPIISREQSIFYDYCNVYYDKCVFMLQYAQTTAHPECSITSLDTMPLSYKQDRSI